MDNLETMKRGEVEHGAWIALCDQLRETGAVTEADGAASTTATATPGQRLFVALRAWGEALHQLRTAQAAK